MSDKEKKHAYDSLDHKGIDKKVAGIMTKLVIGDIKNGPSLFDEVRENLSKDEMAFLATIFVAQQTAEHIEKNPVLKMMGEMAQDIKEGFEDKN